MDLLLMCGLLVCVFLWWFFDFGVFWLFEVCDEEMLCCYLYIGFLVFGFECDLVVEEMFGLVEMIF